MPRPKHEEPNEAATHRNGRMTRVGMVRVIEGGGSVLHNGSVYTRVEDLPDESEIVAGDAEATEAAMSALDREQADIDLRRARLQASKGEAASAPTPHENPESAPEGDDTSTE